MDEVWIALFGLLATVVAQIVGLAYWLGRKFATIDERFEEVDMRFKAVERQIADLRAEMDKRFAEVDRRFAEFRGDADRRFQAVERQIVELRGDVERRFTELKGDVDRRFTELREEMDKRFAELRGEMDRRFAEFRGEVERRFQGVEKRIEELGEELRGEIRRSSESVLSAAVAMNTFVVDFVALKGLFTEGERDFAKAQLRAIAGVAAPNPVSREELEFIKAVFSKPDEEISFEELDKALDILWRWFLETYKVEVFRAYLYAYMIKASLYFERLKKKKEGGGGPGATA
ncbi:hypothetical protein [Pyrobaculum calidifontis]|uniref:hypothetical protein n=1 Tax=Pyrobaculum calidifontis TaxID=181486 RepID=UPI00186B795D|nr:hypothetical protein [Pyrobaculum calidifontis]